MKAYSPEHIGILSKRQLRTLLNTLTHKQRKVAIEAIRLDRILEDIKFELDNRGGK